MNDINHSHEPYVEDRDVELLKALEANVNMKIHKGLVFKDFPTLRRWLCEYSIKHKRPFKVWYSYVEVSYTVVCNKANCNSRVYAQK